MPAFDDGQAAPSATEADPQTEAPRQLTLADVQQLLAQQEQKTLRAIQSHTARAENRIASRFNTANDAYAKAAALAVKKGFVPADKQADYTEALRQEALTGALLPDAPGADSQPQPPTESDGEVPPEVMQVNQKAAQLYQKYGLTADDPELAEIKTDGTAEQFLDSIREAGADKKARLKTSPPPATTEAARRLAARTPAVSGGGGRPPSRNPIAHINSTDQLLDDEWKNMRQGGTGRT